MKHKIGLYLMTEKGLMVLKAILEEFGPDIIAWVTIGQDSNVQDDYSGEIYQLATTNKIVVTERGKPKPEEVPMTIAISWRWLIPTEQDVQLLVLHDSILPRLRGFNPLVTALINGDSEIGVSAIEAVLEYDAGDIFGQEKASINYPIKVHEAIGIISKLYAKLVIDLLHKYESNSMVGVRQIDRFATYSLWRDEKDYVIDWAAESSWIRRFIDAVGFPYKGARTNFEGIEYIIDEVTEHPELEIENRTPGKVIFIKDSNPYVVCGAGVVEITQMRFAESQISSLPWRVVRARFG